MALDARSGEEMWSRTFAYEVRGMLTGGVTRIRPYDDWLAYNEKNGLLLAGKSGEVRALDGKTGSENWHDTSGGMQPLILGDDSFVNQSGHRYDLADGRRLTDDPLFRRGGCNYAVGNSSLLFVRDKRRCLHRLRGARRV